MFNLWTKRDKACGYCETTYSAEGGRISVCGRAIEVDGLCYMHAYEKMKVDKERMEKALRWWLAANKGAPNKCYWAEKALRGGDK